MLETDSDILEWEQELAEIKQMGNEINEINNNLDKFIEYYYIFKQIPNLFKNYHKNIIELFHVIKIVSDENKYLCGTLLVGLVSAYEGMVQDILELMSTSSDLDRNSLYQKFQQLDEFKRKFNSEDDFFKELNKMTLNNPFNTFKLLDELFELNLIKKYSDKLYLLDECKSKELIEIRNDFVHKAGKNKLEKISTEYLKIIFYSLHTLCFIYQKDISIMIEQKMKNAEEKLPK